MTKLRNKTIVKKVLIRDMGLCQCCGLDGDEVHHITPLVFGGEDSPRNMITLCYTCHKYAPDNKHDFLDYKKLGGSRTSMLLGKAVSLCEIKEKEDGIKFHESLNICRKAIQDIRIFCGVRAIEKYGFYDRSDIDEVDFSEI